jgi:ComF family protein
MGWLESLLFEHCCVLCGGPTTTSPCSSCLAPTPVLDVQSPPLLSHIFVAYPYDSPAGDLIRISKSNRERAPLKRLCTAVAHALGPALQRHEFDAIVPVPSHWRRQIWRGFNTPDLLAEELALQLNCEPLHVLTNRASSAQKGRDRLDRRKHAQQRFYCTATVKDARLLLVDDITTTGATLAVCASELLGSGASRVSALTLCAVS